MPATERKINVGPLSLCVMEQGEGPLVLMVHGFPGLAYSWRHQMEPLAEAGYRAVAVDLPGYGGSDRPLELEFYTSDRIQDYLLKILDTYKADQAVIVGQDFGAQYAWNFAVRAGDRTRALVATIPYDYDIAGRAMLGSAPRLPPDAPARPDASSPDRLPSERFAAMAVNHFIHFHYFQKVGPAERELGNALRDYLKRIFHALSAEGDLWRWKTVPSEGSGYLDALPPAPDLPWSWLSREEFDTIVAAYDHPDLMRRVIGGLNAYRSSDRNWQIGAAWADADVTVPTLFIYGAKDPSFGFFPDWEARMRRRVPGLRKIVAMEDAGHLLQQERPAVFNRALLDFLAGA
ncbi:MAG: alpha/beta hydrolase [Rhodospirillaceae bacterium]|nr:alpha/beta hydrolase [Rhodospirillaceae bacterium]